MLERVEHMQIPVRNVKEAVQWYTHHLGFRLEELTEGRHAFLTLHSGPMLMLWETPEETHANFTVRGETMPVLLYRTSDIHTLYDKLHAAGTRIAFYKDEGFGRVLKFYDPNGNLWGVIQPNA